MILQDQKWQAFAVALETIETPAACGRHTREIIAR
jgi:hypothetical protein